MLESLWGQTGRSQRSRKDVSFLPTSSPTLSGANPGLPAGGSHSSSNSPKHSPVLFSPLPTPRPAAGAFSVSKATGVLPPPLLSHPSLGTSGGSRAPPGGHMRKSTGEWLQRNDSSVISPQVRGCGTGQRCSDAGASWGLLPGLFCLLLSG